MDNLRSILDKTVESMSLTGFILVKRKNVVDKIDIMNIYYSFYCTKCESMATSKTCPHDKKFHIGLSRTRVRDMLREGKCPPKEMTRPEVADVLIRGMAAASSTTATKQ